MTFGYLETGHQFKVTLGKSLDAKPKKKAQKFFSVKNTFSSDLSVFGKDAKLEKKNDRYQVEMKHTKKPNVVYDVQVTTEEEYNCILIYNEETKTFTLERQSAQINLLNRKLELPSTVMADLQLPATPQQVQTPPTISTTPIIVTPTATPMEVDEAEEDSDFDLSKDMDAILDSDDSEDQTKQTGNNNNNNSSDDDDDDVFEEIQAPIITPQPQAVPSPLNASLTPSLVPNSPNIPLNLALPTTPIHSTTMSPSSQQQQQQQSKKRKLKMASAPIRHPGTASPAITQPTQPQQSLALPTSVHTNNTKKPAIPPRHSDADSSSSGSGSDSDSEGTSSGSESGSSETDSSSGSEESGSSEEEDDDDFESLVNDISMSISKGGPSAPASPQRNLDSPQNASSSPYSSSARPAANNNSSAGPMSLRALFTEDNEEEEGLSSSESEDDDSEDE